MKKPYFPFFPGDYLADTIGLSCCEHGVYLLLLAVSWKRGPLPDDMDHLSRLAADPPIEALRFILQEYWSLTELGWVNARMEIERAKAEEKSRKAKKSALARWGGDANALRTQSERYAIHNHNHNHNQKKEDKERSVSSAKSAAPRAAFVKPTLAEVQAYVLEKRLAKVDAEAFMDHYDSNGWKVGGKAMMKDWKATIRGWNRRDIDGNGNAKSYINGGI